MFMRSLTLFCCLVASAPAITPAEAQTPSDSRQRVHVTVQPLTTDVVPGGDLPIAVIFDMEPDWHIYAHGGNVPEDYYRTIVEVESASPGIHVNAGFIQWPPHHPMEFDGELLDVYDGRLIVYIPVTIARDAPLGPAVITVKPGFQTCDDTSCLQPTPYPPKELDDEVTQAWLDYGHAVTINIVSFDQAPPRKGDLPPDFAGFDASVFSRIHAGEKAPDIVKFDLFSLSFDLNAAGTSGLILVLLLGALGGFILNLTPCVLPMIPIKIMALSQSAGNRVRTFLLGLSMSLGIVAFWMGLGLAVAFISGFTATNQLFQYPAFTIAVGVIIAVMAVGMCGVFSLRLPRWVYQISPKHDSMHGSFGFGIMVAVLSTPCTAPFMGGVAFWAALQEPAVVLAAFGAIGAGMAFPYLLLSTFPKLVEKMPRTGPASEVIKQVMGLFMLAAAAYFVGVGISGVLVNPPDPPSRAYFWFVALFVAFAGGWLVLRTVRIAASTGKRLVVGGLGALFVVFAIFLGARMTDEGPIPWVYYTPDRFAEAKAEGNVVVMEFTAGWCINCHTLEQTVLRTRRVVDILSEDGVVPIKVDITNYEAADEMLKSVNRLTIPLLVVFTPDGTEVFKSDAYTPQQIVDAVREAQGDDALVSNPISDH